MLGVTTARRERTFAAAPQELWPLIFDPHHQPRWWPGVERMEGVDGSQFTQVLRSRRGRAVRADFTIVELEEPRLAAWEQELDGTPFARVLTHSLIRIELAVEGTGTRVSLAHDQTLRGSSRTGGIMLRRATGRRLEQALAGLAAIVDG